MHILDIAENSTRAGARNVFIDVVEDSPSDSMTVSVRDDGKGMTPEEVRNALDPFYTTKKERPKVGLGLPLLKATAERCDGSLSVFSFPGRGTVVTAAMKLSHIDRPPMGDFNETVSVLIAMNPDTDFHISYTVDGDTEVFSTAPQSPASTVFPVEISDGMRISEGK